MLSNPVGKQRVHSVTSYNCDGSTSALTKPLTAESAETLLWVLLLLFKLSLVFIISLENI